MPLTATAFILPALAAGLPAVPALAYRPLLDPLPLDDYWLILLLPLAVAIAIVYKTLKVDDLRQLPRQAALLASQIVAFLILAALILWVLLRWA